MSKSKMKPSFLNFFLVVVSLANGKKLFFAKSCSRFPDSGISRALLISSSFSSSSYWSTDLSQPSTKRGVLSSNLPFLLRSHMSREVNEYFPSSKYSSSKTRSPKDSAPSTSESSCPPESRNFFSTSIIKFYKKIISNNPSGRRIKKSLLKAT